MNKNEDIVTLTRCDNSILADEIVSRLASKGIVSSLHDELNAPVYGAYGPNPGIEVKVFQKDLEQSRSILKEINKSQFEMLPCCPYCGSEKVRALYVDEDKRSKFSIFIGAFFIAMGCIGIILPNFVEVLSTMRLYSLIISPFVLLCGVLMVLPKQARQYYQCNICGQKFCK